MSLGRVALVAAALAACTGEIGPGAAPDAEPELDLDVGRDPTVALFAPDHVVEVAIELAADDWDALRAQTRSWVHVFGTCLEQPFADPFTWFPATVTVDGTRVTDVAVRKKGFLGSLSDVRPSLKISFDERVPDRVVFGMKGLTLNNAQQDPSFVRQCLAYRTFTAAGIPAPRCNVAHVTVNGADLGLYVHVEPVNRRFLARHFADDGGLLYEGTLSDFRAGWTATFEQKTDEATPDRAAIDAVVAALELPDDALLAALEPLVDVDQLIRFWATEVLVTHWDGYTGNANNFFAYLDPADGRLRFLPWGVDGTLVPGADPFGTGVASVQATSLLPYRLYRLPETRARYVAAMRDLLDRVWDEAALEAELDRVEALIAPYATPAAELDEVRRFVRERRGQVLAELDAPPAWDAPLRGPPCFARVGRLAATVETTWATGGGDAFATGGGALGGTLHGAPVDVAQVGASAGVDPDDAARVRLVATARRGDGDTTVVVFSIAGARFAPGATLTIDYVDVVGTVYHHDAQTGGWSRVGIVPAGTLRLDAAGTTAGAAVRASFDAPVSDAPY